MFLLVLSAADVDKIASTLTLDDLQYLMAQIFARLSSSSAGHGSGLGVSMPPRISIQTDNHTALFMPARIGPPPPLGAGSGTSSDSTDQLGQTAIKVVSVPKKDSSKGLPATTLVLDEATGSVKAVVNARKLTALRNAAGSLLSTSLVGPTQPRSIIAFGAGQQIDAHLDLHLRQFATITKCTIVNRTLNARAVSLRERLATRFLHLDINLLSSNADANDINSVQQLSLLEQTLRSADIIICATSSTTPLFPSTWVKNGTHVILIGSYTPSMREVEKALVLRSIPSQISLNNPTKRLPILLVDSRDACSHESGELIDAKIAPLQMTEIGEIIPKNEANIVSRESYLSNLKPPGQIRAGFDGPISIFKSVGVGLQDVAIASAIVDKACSMEGIIGTRIQDYDT